MQFTVLGSLEVIREGVTLDLERPKQRAVLAVLLLEANRVVSLDRLIDLLWGGEPPARSTASLQSYISNLRRILEPDRSPRTPPTILVTEPPGYVLRIDPQDLDATRFETLAGEGARLLGDGRPEEALAALDAALALWRGPVLADFAYEDFARDAAVRWDELRGVAVEDRIEALLALGRHDRAAAELEALVADAPLRERRWRLLMLALYRSGRQADALRAYARARAILVDELGIDPGPDLARLEADILSQAPQLDWRPPTHPAGAVREPPGAPIVTPGGGDVGAGAPSTSSKPFVGRAAQLSRLTAALDDVAAGQGRTLLVTGEAGIGKTRLLEELAAAASRRGALVAWGRSFEGADPPFWAWVQALRALAAEADPGAMLEGAGAGAASVAQLVPELDRRWGDDAPPSPQTDPETARFRLYEAVGGMLDVAARDRPLVVLLDDVQWADPGSLAVTEFVASQGARGGVLLVISYRPEDVAPDHPLVATRAVLARLPQLERVELEGLPPPEVAEFVAGSAGLDPSPDLVEALHSRTEGNPFYLGELVRLLTAERALTTPAAVVAAGVPQGVRDVIRRRLARLPESTTRVLTVAAVVGQEFEVTLLAAAAGVAEEDALVAVEAALLVGLAVEEPTSVGRARFAHSLVRDTLYEQLSALRRARMHGDVVRALEGRVRGDDRIDELAHHSSLAAPADGPERAFEYTMRAAEAAQSRLAYEDAQAYARRAIDLARAMPSPEEAARRETAAQLRLAALVSMVGSFAASDAGPAFDRAAELCRLSGEADQLLAALAGQWIVGLMHGDFAAARAACDRIVAFGEASGDPTSVMLGEFHTGYLNLHSGAPAESIAHLDAALERARVLDPVRLVEMFHLVPETLFLAISAIAHSLLGEESEARVRADQALALARESGHPYTLTIALANTSVVEVFGGDADRLLPRLDEGVALAAEWGLRADEALLRAFHGWAVAKRGDAASGADEAAAALAELRAAGRVMSSPLLHWLLAEAQQRAGRVDDAVATVDEGIRLAEATGERLWDAELLRLRGELVLERSPAQPDEAATWLCRALETATAQAAPGLRRRAEESLARLGGSYPGSTPPAAGR